MFITQPQVITPPTLVDGPVLTLGTAASCIPTNSKITLPNNYWYPGRKWRMTSWGRVSSVITTPGTARFDLRIGGVIAWDSQAVLLDTVAAHTTVAWKLVVELTCRSVGSGTATTLVGSGMWISEDILGVPATAPKGVLTAMLPWNATPGVPGTGFDNTLATNTVDLFFTQTAATGSLTVHDYMIEEMN